VIRQAISCDICGRDKQQTNHWFVVYEHGSELRISGWSSQARMSMKARHLCGQTCLHKLIDEYMARTLAAAFSATNSETALEEKTLPVSIEEKRPAIPAQPRMDASLTSAAAHARPLPITARASEVYVDDYESSASLVPSPEEKRPVIVAQPRTDARLSAVSAAPKPMNTAPPAPETDVDDYESSASLIQPPESIADPEVEPIPISPNFNSRAWRTEAWKREREREEHGDRNAVHPRRRSLV
jgi:hypothetical protein